MRILVADDDPLQRELMQAQLAAWGHATVLAADGDEAWRILDGGDAPRLVLVDWMMPPPDGPELCRRLRQAQAPATYVIMVTSKDRDEDLIAGLEAGADDYLTKPVDPGQLRARIDVGERILQLQERLLATERLRVVGETAGAAAHEIRQPLALIQATVQLSQRVDDPTGKLGPRFEQILEAVRRIDGIVERMSGVDRYRTRRYVDGVDIVDFEDDDDNDPG